MFSSSVAADIADGVSYCRDIKKDGQDPCNVFKGSREDNKPTKWYD